MKKRTYRIFVAFAILAVLIAIGVAGNSIFRQHTSQRNMPDIQVPYTKDQGQQASNDTGIQEAVVIEASSTESSQGLPEDSYFEIDFFDVGEADSTLVKCDGHYMLIDGGNPESSSFLYAYLQQNEIDYIDYMICTHAHEDHVGGLAGALNYARVETVYCPVTEYDTRAFNSFVKYLEEQGKSITIPAAGDAFMLGNARVQIVGPVDMSLVVGDNANNTSIVVHITYGNTAFLITGDAEEIEEQSIVDAGYDIRSTVLRVGHHGSYTSSSENFLGTVAPEYCVISVGKDNAYDHPHDEVLNRIARYGAEIYRTDLNGDITCVSDGETVRFGTEK